MTGDITHRHFKVPREDRSLLAIPPLNTAAALVAENRILFGTSNCRLHDRSLQELRESTRREAMVLARAFTSSLLQTDVSEATSDSVVVTGHQPELFHVGVWAKNFSLAGVARSTHSVAVNLIVDNDTMNGTSLRIPVGSRAQMRIERSLYDSPQPTQPWEEASIRDRSLFERFGATVRDQIRQAWGFEPLIGSTWDAAIRQSRVSPRLCDSLTALRVNVERAWGQNNLELPMSQLCQTESFYWFAAHLMTRCAEVNKVYNEAVADYRRSHRLRNRMQPVPDLESTDGWFESPFWVWNRGDFQRGRLFVRRTGSEYELRNEKDVFARISLSENGPLDPAVEVLRNLVPQGIRLRTRALTTTLFARVCLADIFLHGIGGAKYDEMTNRLCQRLFGLKAPEFLTVSATLHMPLGGAYDSTEAELREIHHKIRDLNYNPDRHLIDHPDAAPLIEEKTTILRDANTLRESNQMRGRLNPAQHRRISEIRSKLGAQTAAIHARYERTRANIQAQITANSLIRNREYSFVLYPEEVVRPFLTPLSNMPSDIDSRVGTSS